MTGIQFILLLPSTIVSSGGMMRDDPLQINGKGFLLWAVLYLAGYAVSFIIDLMLVMCFFIYLDDPEMNVCGIIKDSISMMRGNKFRYFYMLLSFLGYWLLVILSLGIAALWVVPYQTMTSVAFYNDLRADQISVEEL